MEFEQVIVNALDPTTLANWCDALGWAVFDAEDDCIEIRRTPTTLPGLLFLPVPDHKVGFNRLHLDFRPDDQNVEVERLLALGATRADVGQGDDVSRVVLADPEGNEFCVLGSRTA